MEADRLIYGEIDQVVRERFDANTRRSKENVDWTLHSQTLPAVKVI